MTKKERKGNTNLAIGSLLMITAVILGAFGAHGLKPHLSEYQMEIYEKGILYHVIHAFGFFILGFANVLKIFYSKIVSWLMGLGILFFSGSLYLLAIDGAFISFPKLLGILTPIGGLLFISAWTIMAIHFLKR